MKIPPMPVGGIFETFDQALQPMFFVVLAFYSKRAAPSGGPFLLHERARMSTNSNGLYTSKIINAGALLADTKTLLAHWDETQTVAENLRCAQQENIFGKASRAWVKQFLGIFQQRYLADETTTKALVTLAKEGLPAASLDRLLYFHAAQADRLLHDTVTEVSYLCKCRVDLKLPCPIFSESLMSGSHWVKQQQFGPR